MFFGSKQKQIDNAQTEGDDIVEQEPEREEARVPVALDELYRRYDSALRPYAALLAIQSPPRSVLDEPEFEVFRADLIDNGHVAKIDLAVCGKTRQRQGRMIHFPM
jgi:hypothetical protein